MNSFITELEKKALSNNDISKITDNKCNIYLYKELLKFKTLDQILGKYGACVILYESSEYFGHWCCIIKQSDKLVEFFDPYSSKPDREFQYVPEQYKEIPYLSKLMYDSPYELSYNEHRFQKLKQNVNTCGRHCAMRCVLRHMPLEKYAKLLLHKNETPDELVTIFTEFLLLS